MKLGLYIKRGIKYILKEHKQPIVKIETVQKSEPELFEGKNYIITGAGSGLGYYIAKKLIQAGSKVIITGRNEEKLKKAQKELGENCEYIVNDIQNIKDSDKMLNYVFNKYKRIDGIINNAGISLHEWDFLKVDEEKYESQFNTNLKGAYFFTQHYIKKILEKNESGNIVFISSERGSMCDDLPYGLTKASINSLVKALSFEYYKKGIRVNAISPGITASDMTGINKQDDLYSDNNSERYFVPEEVAEVVAFILSDCSKCISGEVIHTNAGNHIKRGY